MILVLTGTTNFPFTRLHKIVSNAITRYKINERVIIQSRDKNLRSIYHPRNVEILSEIPFEKLTALLATARVIITHAGPGIIFLAKSHSKNSKIYIFPRISQYGEHVNNHQLYFARFIKNNLFTNSRNQLINKIDQYIKKI